MNTNRVGEEAFKILNQYFDVLNDEVHAVLKKEAQKAKKEVAAASPKRTGDYSKGWSIKDDSTRITSEFKIYNKLPGLPHLLEFGHTIRNGTGRSFGHGGARPHIAAVNDELQATVVKTIENAIKGVGV